MLDDNFMIFIFATDLHATDLRDFIYGILDALDLPVDPDYEKSVKLVFTEISRIGLKLGYFSDIVAIPGMSEAEGSQGKNGAYNLGYQSGLNLHAENHISHPSANVEKASEGSARIS